MRARQIGPSTLRKDVIMLGTIFKMAVRWGVLEASPGVDLLKPPEPTHKTRYLTPEEFDRLDAACPPWLRSLVRMAVATGAVRKEVTDLLWDDVDRTGGMIHLPEDTKTGTRPIPINDTARDVLESQVRHLRSPHVFLDSAGQPYASRNARERISKSIRTAAKRASLSDVGFATLRHTTASWMVQAGVPLYEVQKYIGHGTPAMKQRYAYLTPENLRAGGRAVDAVLARATQAATQETARS